MTTPSLAPKVAHLASCAFECLHYERRTEPNTEHGPYAPASDRVVHVQRCCNCGAAIDLGDRMPPPPPPPRQMRLDAEAAAYASDHEYRDGAIAIAVVAALLVVIFVGVLLS